MTRSRHRQGWSRTGPNDDRTTPSIAESVALPFRLTTRVVSSRTAASATVAATDALDLGDAAARRPRRRAREALQPPRRRERRWRGVRGDFDRRGRCGGWKRRRRRARGGERCERGGRAAGAGCETCTPPRSRLAGQRPSPAPPSPRLERPELRWIVLLSPRGVTSRHRTLFYLLWSALFFSLSLTSLTVRSTSANKSQR